MENNDKNLKITNTKYTLKESPHYEEQKDEIEILNNIIPDRLTIESEDPNYILNIIVKSSLDNPEKEYRLKIYLNYFYPEKSPRFEFYEINDFLQESRKKEAISRLNKVLEENLGITTLFQLYESAIEFADEEEERRKKVIEEYNKQNIEQIRFPLNQMKIYKKFDDIFVTDLVVLKNGYLVLASCEDKYAPRLRIIDESYTNKIYEINLIENAENKKYQFIIKKMFLYSISNTEDELFILCSDKNVIKYKITYLKTKIKKTGLNIIIGNSIKNYYSDFSDMLFLKDYNCFLFLCKDEIIFWKYNEKFEIIEDSIIKRISNENNSIEIFDINKNFFVLTSSRNSEILFLHFVDNNLKKNKWGKKVKIPCSKTQNYVIKIDDKNILFGNDNARLLFIIYIPTGEIVTKYEWNSISSIFRIFNSIYLCHIKGIDEISFKKIILSEVENNNKITFNNIKLIKPIEKGYYVFSRSNSFMICK